MFLSMSSSSSKDAGDRQTESPAHHEDAAQLPKKVPPKLNSPMDDKSVAWKGYNSESSSSRTARNIASAFCHQVLQARCNCEVFQLLKAGVKLKVAWHVPTFIFEAVILTFCQESAPVSLFLRMR